MNYKIVEFPAFKVMGISQRIKTTDAFNIIPSIWNEAWSDGTIQNFLDNFPNYRPSGILGIAQGGQWEESEYIDYIIGVTNYIDSLEYKEFPLIDGMKEFNYPSAKWIIINANGDYLKQYKNYMKNFILNGFQIQNIN